MAVEAKAALLAFALLTGVSASCTPEISPRAEKLSNSIPELMEEAGIPGLSIALVEKGRLSWVGSFGVKNTESGEMVDGESVFEAASLSKPVVAAALMQMVMRDEFDLDRPLAETLEYPRLNHDDRYQRITARMVLSHTTGLPNWGGTPLRLNRDPGSRWGYSGEGFVYLQKTLEHRLSQPLDDLVAREVFEPLGVTRSSFVWRDSYKDQAVNGHDELGRPRPLEPKTTANAAASLMTTAGEYGRFLEALLGDQGLAPGTLDRMKTFQTAVAQWGDPETHEHVGWGLGWGTQEGERGTSLWHWGDNGNHRCFVILYPEQREGLVYFTNSNGGLSIAGAILDSAFPDDHWWTRFLSYDAYDDPKRKARIEVRKAFLENGSEAGLRLLEELRQDQPNIIDGPFMSALGEFLLDEDHSDAAVRVLEINAAAQPEVKKAQKDLGEGLMRAGLFERSLEVFSGLGDLEPRKRWIEELAAAENEPILLSAEDLDSLVGNYGPRQIRSREGRLYYERQGGGREYPLYPIKERVFGLEGMNTFRLEFVSAPDGTVSKVVGHYFDGRKDQNLRDP